MARQRFPCLPAKAACRAISTRSASSRCWSRARSTCSPSAGASMGTRDAAHKLVTSHLRLVAKIAMGYRGYGLPIGEVMSEGNVGLMQAVKRFEPDKGFRLATYAMWWIKAAIQEYILRSWSLVKMGTTANQKKLFFNLRKAKGRISALDEGDLRPDQVKQIATQLGVTEQDVIDMNRRLGGDASLNAPLREEGEGEWQDWLVDDSASQETIVVAEEEGQNRLAALRDALSVLNPRERRIFEARRLADDPITLEDSRPSSASRASACARSRCAPSRRSRRRSRRTSPPARRRAPPRPRVSAATAVAAALLLPPLAEGVADDLLARDALLEAQDGALPGGEADRQVDPVRVGEQVGVALDVRGRFDSPIRNRFSLTGTGRPASGVPRTFRRS